VDQVLHEEFPELPVVRQYYPQFFHKTDRWGRPVWIELLGQIDIDAMLKVCAAGWLQEQKPDHQHQHQHFHHSSLF
jgi:hypothetical protein